jgi:hypothetical protein
MNQKFIDKLTDIIAYGLLPITYPIHLWKYRNWKRNVKKKQPKTKKYH